ncbi:YpmS family protein [Paenalkalicoccus suaedae]|uniref:YpmS family protein n=1 Tax=Paenalkalicoccus suaedae TaxID=2592382 RepID=A0A859FET2_9BACI|nr:YpmS family protein [Paenalkalicoccus suaedae]QKS70746.1 YpmS family protein [Paenalkalicoccus suaedae]
MNRWKIAFFSLIALLLLLLIGGGIWINQQLPDASAEPFDRPAVDTVEGPSFTVTTTREDLNSWLQQELQGENQEFDITIDEAVYFQTELALFGVSIPVEMTLVPEVTEEGNLWLLEDSFRVASFELPSEQVFALIESTVDLPEWITVAQNERGFYVDIVNGVSEDFQIQVESLDLEQNDIELLITSK